MVNLLVLGFAHERGFGIQMSLLPNSELHVSSQQQYHASQRNIELSPTALLVADLSIRVKPAPMAFLVFISCFLSSFLLLEGVAIRLLVLYASAIVKGSCYATITSMPGCHEAPSKLLFPYIDPEASLDSTQSLLPSP